MCRRARALATLGVLLTLVVGLTPARAATAAPSAPMAQAYILVDADTGNVLAEQDARSLHLPASTIKLMTALMAAERLPATDVVPISALAESMPARKINVKANQTWTLTDLMHCLLMISANDAAVAIAERTAGTLDQWAALATATGTRLGLADGSVFNDPAGLDDEFSHGGGSLVSARDLAIISRAVLARPDLMALINTKEYSFTGGDGLGHNFTNHDLFLGSYVGATGLKTGATDRAGRTFVASATRNGRTMLAVQFASPDIYASAAALLDHGFATEVAAESTVDALPPVVHDAAKDPPPVESSGEVAAAESVRAPVNGFDLNSPPVAVATMLLGVVALAVVRTTMEMRYARLRDLRLSSYAAHPSVVD